MASRKKVYRITFASQGKMYEIYARKVSQGELYGFIEVEEIVYGEKSSIVVDPGEEQLKREFAGVCRAMIPFHAVQRIDEVEREGAGKVIQLASTDTASTSVASNIFPPKSIK